MTRSCAALCALMLAAAPAAAQVGHMPAESPYRDLPWKQALTVFGGGFKTGNDPAGVGPQPGSLMGLRYGIRIGGPISLVARLAGAPSSRRLLDPTKPAASRYIGDQSSELFAGDLGLEWNLTGQKSWHRIVPVIDGGVGMVSDFHGIPDAGGYRFGTRFMFTWGAGIRYHTDGRWEPRLDFTNYVWQLQYPPSYAATQSDGSPGIVKNAKKGLWMGNHLLSLGLSYQLFR
ncbi:MAG: hypothetical protein ACYC3L_07045 [Gemmatimonadaceae bacterium]